MRSLGSEISTAQAILATSFNFKPPLTYFLQVKIKNESGKLIAYPDAGSGSGDFANLKDVDGFLELPADKTEFKTGEVIAIEQLTTTPLPFLNTHPLGALQVKKKADIRAK